MERSWQVTLQFGVFDHIEPIPDVPPDRLYRERLLQVERFDAAGFYAYNLVGHHTPAVHSLAPSQNVFLAAASQRTQRLRLVPCIYVLPLHHPLRLIEEICMLDHLSEGRLEVGVGRGGVLEAYFWDSDADVEGFQRRYLETLAIIKQGLSHDELTYHGRNARLHPPIYGGVRDDWRQLLRLCLPVGPVAPRAGNAVHRTLCDRSDAPLHGGRTAVTLILH